MFEIDEIDLNTKGVETVSLGYKIFNQEYSCRVSNRDHTMIDNHDEIEYESANREIYTSSGMCQVEVSNDFSMAMDEIVLGRAGFDPSSEYGQEYLDALETRALTINNIVELRYLDAYIEFDSLNDIKDIYNTLYRYLGEDVFDPIHQAESKLPEEDIEKIESLMKSLESYINGEDTNNPFIGLMEQIGHGMDVQETETFTKEELGIEVESNVVTEDGDVVEVYHHVSPYLSKHL